MNKKKSRLEKPRLTLASPTNFNRAHLFPIVGVGASAGGLESFSQLLNELPCDTGMAFVLIQHLDPNHQSFLTEALTKITKMPVTEITDGMKAEPDHVYVIPSSSDVGILDHKFSLFSRSKTSPRPPHMAVDFFFRALAAECGSQALGIVLSGTANDGTEGLRAIKAENGVTFAQDPKSAKFDGMPLSAVRAEVVDFCLPIPKIAQELIRLAHHPYLLGKSPDPFSEPKDAQELQKIFVLIRAGTGINFSEYKLPTIKRRLARRMALLKISNLGEYIARLKESPEEIKAIAADVLIHVTSFFRDKNAFEGLKVQALPGIIKNKEPGSPIRIWVAGCSTGEEVYSIAIILLEFLGSDSAKYPIQIFGSDISEAMIEKGRAGFFAENLLKDIDPERLRRFFVKVDGGYRISKLIRDLCVFVRHDLARDPPFSKLDLVTCRNVLIYFEQALQKRIISTFHYCLNQPGILFLGRTEGISGHSQLFSNDDKINKIFSREPVNNPLRFSNIPNLFPLGYSLATRSRNNLTTDSVRPPLDVAKQFENFLLKEFSPAGVAINDRMEILQFNGQTSVYLEQPTGQPQLNLLKMVREGLFAPLKVALGEAKKKMTVIRKEGVEFNHSGIKKLCNITVAPISRSPESLAPFFLVIFEDRPYIKKESKTLSSKEADRGTRLEHELRSTQEYLQALSDDNQKTNDALTTVNEELVSGNEELQSMNEELETAKEELQSTNEELTTVNDELQTRNQETAQINDDLVNLLNSVEIPILILDLNRHIRRFTPKARKLMNLLSSDVGRSIDDIKSNINIKSLNEEIQEVIETATTKESEVQDNEGQWYRLQIKPYKSADNKIVGAVLSLIDINALRILLGETQLAKEVSDKANISKDFFLATLSHELRTPLTSLMLQANMLSRGAFDEKVKRASKAIENAAKKQSQLIEDLLDVSRIVTNKLKLEMGPVDPKNIIIDAVDNVAALAENKSIIIETDLDTFRGQVSADPARLQQVVSNLLTNAIKFSTKDAKVGVTLTAVDGFAIIKVTDKGIGITPEFLPHIFNRFSQEDDTKTRIHGGLGLGLAIVNHLVELHNGSVQAESSGKDMGATFTVKLPLIKGSSEKIVMRSIKGRTSANLNGLRILVAEDDDACREALVEMLKDAGAEVKGVASASEAIDVFKAFNPTELVSDIAMPNEDGYSLLGRIRKLLPKGKIIPAIALTALASEHDHQDALSAGFQIHITKPFNIDQLTDALLGLHEEFSLLAGGEK